VTALRVVALAAGALALAVAGAGLVPRRSTAPVRPAAQPAQVAVVKPAVAATAAASKPARDLRDLPAGMLSRAADARALDRAPTPACRPPPRQDDAACAPKRDTVEVRWDVGKGP
jgi:hypothetical protein